VSDELAHPADVRVVEEEGDGGFSDGTGFFGFVFLTFFLGFFGRRAGFVFPDVLVIPGNDLYGAL